MSNGTHISNNLLLPFLSRLLHSSAADLLAGSAAHAVLLKLHNAPNQSISLWNKLLHIYSRSNRPDLAHKLFDQIPQRDSISYNTLISARNRLTHSTQNSLSLYSCLLAESLKPDPATFAVLLTGARIGPLEQIHSHSIKFGLNSDAFVGSALVNSYEKNRGLEEAIRAFEEIDGTDSVSWNVMIDACARSGDKTRAVDIFSRMRKECSSVLDGFTLTSVLKTCFERADLGLGMQLHSCTVKAGLESETPVGNSLITMYSRCGGGMGSASSAFRDILEPNVISWTAMIGGLGQSGMAEEASSLYKRMVGVGTAENEFLFASVLPVFGAMASLELGRMVHSRIVKSVFWSDVGVGNALIDMYFKCGSLEDAQLVFSSMRRHDLVSWTVMITGLGQHGKAKEALEVFREMGGRGFRPDNVTFLAGLSACSHGGYFEEGLRMFRSMVDDYRMKPRREHFACVVDMLGRAGKLKEAERFIGEMGMESDPLAWEALLGACMMHGEMDLGKRSTKKVMELEPDKDGPYVQLSNIYAERRMWEEKDKLRRRLDASGLRKEAAQSWI